MNDTVQQDQKFIEAFERQINELPEFSGVNPALLETIATTYCEHQRAVTAAEQFKAAAAARSLAYLSNNLLNHLRPEDIAEKSEPGWAIRRIFDKLERAATEVGMWPRQPRQEQRGKGK